MKLPIMTLLSLSSLSYAAIGIEAYTNSKCKTKVADAVWLRTETNSQANTFPAVEYPKPGIYNFKVLGFYDNETLQAFTSNGDDLCGTRLPDPKMDFVKRCQGLKGQGDGKAGITCFKAVEKLK